MKRFLCPLALFAMLAACEPATKISKSWRDPAVTIDKNSFSKVLIVGLLKDESSRRIVEDNLVKRLAGKGVASYTQNFSGKEGDAVESQLKAEGYDGAIVIRLVDIEKETNYVPGTAYPGYYGRFGGYYGYAYGAYGSEGYYTTDKIYSVETNLYSLKIDKLIWSGVTTTTNPGKVEKVITEIADAVAQKMKDEGFMAVDPKPKK